MACTLIAGARWNIHFYSGFYWSEKSVKVGNPSHPGSFTPLYNRESLNENGGKLERSSTSWFTTRWNGFKKVKEKAGNDNRTLTVAEFTTMCSILLDGFFVAWQAKLGANSNLGIKNNKTTHAAHAAVGSAVCTLKTLQRRFQTCRFLPL